MDDAWLRLLCRRKGRWRQKNKDGDTKGDKGARFSIVLTFEPRRAAAIYLYVIVYIESGQNFQETVNGSTSIPSVWGIIGSSGLRSRRLPDTFQLSLSGELHCLRRIQPAEGPGQIRHRLHSVRSRAWRHHHPLSH